jgi:C4-dicarboxylate transporter DctQ subunit
MGIVRQIGQACESAGNRLSQLGGQLSGIAVLLMIGITVYSVLMRYVFRSPVIWAVEINEYLLVACGFLAAAYVQRENRHVRVMLVASRMPPNVRHFLALGTHVLGLIYCLVLTWQGIDLVLRSYHSGAKSMSWLGTPLFIPQILVPVGSTIWAFAFAFKIYHVSRRQQDMARRETGKFRKEC